MTPASVPLGIGASRRRCWRSLVAGAGWLLPGLFTGEVPAQPVAASANGGAAMADAVHWLSRVQSAAQNRSYQGTMVNTAGGVVSSSRVLHVCEGRQRYERIDVLDGRARSQFRHNDQLVTVWPGSRTAVIERADPVVDFPGLPAGAAQQAPERYELRSVGADRVAGRDADVLMLRPRDALRFAQRWWADRDTGLLLRADTLGSKGEVLESTTFTDLSLASRLSPEAVLAPMKRLDGLRVVRAVPERAQLEAEGWNLARSVAGFQFVACSKRPLGPAADDPPAPQVLQTVYSDGVTHVSLFIEPYDAQRHKPMRTAMGATHTVMNRHADWWVTVMGEVPMATLQQFEAALERRH